jgi:hypothetical protein
VGNMTCTHYHTEQVHLLAHRRRKEHVDQAYKKHKHASVAKLAGDGSRNAPLNNNEPWLVCIVKPRESIVLSV